MSLLRQMVAEALGNGKTKIASVPPKASFATGPTATTFLNKVASALEHVADGLVKSAQADMDASAFITENLPDGSDIESDRTVSYPAPLSYEQAIYGGGQPVAAQPDMMAAMAVDPIDGAMMPGRDDLTGYQSLGEPTGFESLASAGSRKRSPEERAKAAMDRALGKVKVAVIRKRAAEDETMVDNLGGDGGGTGDPSSMLPIPNSEAQVPQSTEAVIDVSNTETDASKEPNLAAVLGPEAVAAADADSTEEEVLEHSSGEEEPVSKQAAMAGIMSRAVLTRIAQGG